MTRRLSAVVVWLVLCSALSAQGVTAEEQILELVRVGGFSYPHWVSVNPTDGSCWVADEQHDQVVKLAPDGTELVRVGAVRLPRSVSVNLTDGSCWVAGGGEVVELAADGTELVRRAGFGPRFITVSVNPADGSCWVGDYENSWVVKLGPDGAELVRVSGFNHSKFVSVNPADGTCWVGDQGRNQVVKLAADGTELVRVGGFSRPYGLSVNPADGSCWVADYLNNQVVKLAADGTELVRVGGFNLPVSVSVNPTDGSCWVADTFNNEAVKLAQDGTELVRVGGFNVTRWVSVNPADGSCWVADRDNHEVVRLGVVSAAPTANLSAYPTSGSAPLTVEFTDLSTGVPTSWLWEFGDGDTSVEQHPSHGYRAVGRFTVSLTAANDMGSDTETKALYIVVTFPDVPLEPEEFWSIHEILACVDARIVAGYDDGLYHPELVVTRGQMAVYIARGLAGGDALVPTGPMTPQFTDVAADYWAYKYVEYAVEQGVATGYSDGTYRPAEVVDRGQMAVYIARSLAGGESGVPGPTAGPTFADVTDENEWSWCYKHVEYIVGEGVAAGYPDGLYHPEYPVTRDQMAVYVARAFELPL